MISFNKSKMLFLDYHKISSLNLLSHLLLFYALLRFSYFLYCITVPYYFSSTTIYFSSLFYSHHLVFHSSREVSYFFHVMVQIKTVSFHQELGVFVLILFFQFIISVSYSKFNLRTCSCIFFS